MPNPAAALRRSISPADIPNQHESGRNSSIHVSRFQENTGFTIGDPPSHIGTSGPGWALPRVVRACFKYIALKGGGFSRAAKATNDAALQTAEKFPREVVLIGHGFKPCR